MDTATVAISGSKTDAGEYKELLVPNVTKIVDAKGRDVTSYYDISYEDGTLSISPRSVTRAEVSAILFRLLSDETRDEYFTTESSFTDVKAGAWYNNSIATLEKAGVIVDTAKGGTFRPDATITRAEMMTLVNRALERVPSDEDHLLSKRVMLTFPDCKSGDWFYIAVQEATNSHTYERAATEKNGDEQWTALRANRDWTLLEK